MSKREVKLLLEELIPEIQSLSVDYPQGEKLVIARTLDVLKNYNKPSVFIDESKYLIREYINSKLVNEIPFLEMIIHLFSNLIRISEKVKFHLVLSKILGKMSELIFEKVSLRDSRWKEIKVRIYSSITEEFFTDYSQTFYKIFYSSNSFNDLFNRPFYEKVFENKSINMDKVFDYFDQRWTFVPNNYFIQLDIMLLFIKTSDIFRIFPLSGLIYSWKFFSFLKEPNSHMIIGHIPAGEQNVLIDYLQNLQSRGIIENYDYTDIQNYGLQTSVANTTYSITIPNNKTSFLDTSDPIEVILSMCELSYQEFDFNSFSKMITDLNNPLSIFKNRNRDVIVNQLLKKNLLNPFTYSNFLSAYYSKGQLFYLRIPSSKDLPSILKRLEEIPLLKTYHNKEIGVFHVIGQMTTDIVHSLEDLFTEFIELTPSYNRQKLPYSEFDQLSLEWKYPNYLYQKKIL